MTFRAFVRSMYLVALCLPTSSVWAEFSIVTTTQELGWVLRTLMKNSGMTDVRVDTLLKGTEDPHHVDAHPSFVLKASNASMLRCNWS